MSKNQQKKVKVKTEANPNHKKDFLTVLAAASQPKQPRETK